jgi:hypothetical protein
MRAALGEPAEVRTIRAAWSAVRKRFPVWLTWADSGRRSRSLKGRGLIESLGSTQRFVCPSRKGGFMRPRPTATYDKVTAIQEKLWPAKLHRTGAKPRSSQHGKSMGTATKGTPRITRASTAIVVHCNGPARQHLDLMLLDGDSSDQGVLAQLLRRPAVLAAGMNCMSENLSASQPA